MTTRIVNTGSDSMCECWHERDIHDFTQPEHHISFGSCRVRLCRCSGFKPTSVSPADEPPPARIGPVWNRVQTLVQDNVKEIAKTGYASKDFEHYVYEEVLTAIYGDAIWPWMRQHRKGE